MSLFRSFIWAFVCFILTQECVTGDTIKEIEVTGFWRKIFEEVNNTTTPIEYSSRYLYGLRTKESDERTVIARTSTRFGISPGDILKILSINIGFDYESSTASKTLSETEIHRQRERTVKFTVPPWTKLVRWQFVVDILGNEYDFSRIWNFANDEVPPVSSAMVTLMLKKEIHFGRTEIRIRHKDTGRYITIVERENWPAATLGLSTRYRFILEDYGENGITIRTLNSMYSGYHFLYAWEEAGRPSWIYGNVFKEFSRCKRLYWFVSEAPPLYDGDVVTFKSKRYEHCYLCQYSSDQSQTRVATDVYSCANREDQWILEVV